MPAFSSCGGGGPLVCRVPQHRCEGGECIGQPAKQRGVQDIQSRINYLEYVAFHDQHPQLRTMGRALIARSAFEIVSPWQWLCSRVYYLSSEPGDVQ